MGESTWLGDSGRGNGREISIWKTCCYKVSGTAAKMRRLHKPVPIWKTAEVLFRNVNIVLAKNIPFYFSLYAVHTCSSCKIDSEVF